MNIEQGRVNFEVQLEKPYWCKLTGLPCNLHHLDLLF